MLNNVSTETKEVSNGIKDRYVNTEHILVRHTTSVQMNQEIRY